MFISIYFKTSSCDSDLKINTFIYGPPPTINSAPVPSPRWTASDWTHVSRAPQFSPFFFFLQAACVALQWEVTGHSNPRLAADHHPIQLSPALCSTVLLSLHPPPVFTSLLVLVTGSYMALIHDKQSTQPTAEWEKQMQNKCKWPLLLSWASSLSMVRSPSHFFWHTYQQKCMI